MRRRQSRRFGLRQLFIVVAVLMALQQGGAAVLIDVGRAAAANVSEGVAAVRGESVAGDVDVPRIGRKKDSKRARNQKERAEGAGRQKDAGRKQRKAAPAGEGTTWQVSNVVDGDTIGVVNAAGEQEQVRVIGVDTPERGECGYTEASDTLAVMVAGKTVTLSPGAVDDRDRYGRLLRYVDVDGRDTGLALIERGLSVAKYDSRDGYGRHPREDSYVAADAAAPNVCDSAAPPPAAVPAPVPVAPNHSAGGPAGGGAWPGCNDARAAGAAPVYAGDPGYGSHLDGDNDGVGCE